MVLGVLKAKKEEIEEHKEESFTHLEGQSTGNL